MALLQEMESITPSKANDPQHLKMWVENYVDLGQYDKALTFIKTLTLTVQGSAMELFEDDQYVQKVCDSLAFRQSGFLFLCLFVSCLSCHNTDDGIRRRNLRCL